MCQCGGGCVKTWGFRPELTHQVASIEGVGIGNSGGAVGCVCVSGVGVCVEIRTAPLFAPFTTRGSLFFPRPQSAPTNSLCTPLFTPFKPRGNPFFQRPQSVPPHSHCTPRFTPHQSHTNIHTSGAGSRLSSKCPSIHIPLLTPSTHTLPPHPSFHALRARLPFIANTSFHTLHPAPLSWAQGARGSIRPLTPFRPHPPVPHPSIPHPLHTRCIHTHPFHQTPRLRPLFAADTPPALARGAREIDRPPRA